MGKFIDLTGKRFGRITVLERDDTKTGDVIFWICKCDCGNTKSICGANIRNGHTQSCGCLREETSARFLQSQSQTRKNNLRLYSIWKSMRHRCYSENHKEYYIYGGRGIKICEQWTNENGFLNFVEWALENGYKNDLTIDRIDMDGNYEPKNCRWITHKENQNNKRTNRYIEYHGETKTLAQWADIYGLRQCELKRRLDYLKLPIGLALTMPSRPKAEYNGRLMFIGALSQHNHINYSLFLIRHFIDGKSANEIIQEYAR